ncbi:LiaF transmembrane domain-containing protein [Alkalihalobacterium sp. APHAB7]|uniref:LiaF transmembrane domain-containing protein n=1 Tax=Alkalihalobacterium sp. APHAB7 TaxID=3402081 RepID=UPI003AAD065C
MKKQGIFPGILFIGVGAYFLLQQFDLPFANQLLTWPSILLIIGIAFLFQSYLGHDSGAIFPGALLLGLGVHFHAIVMFSGWPQHWAMFTLIVGLAFMLLYFRTKRDGLVPAIILFIVSGFGFFSSDLMKWLGSFLDVFEGFWPLLLIALGLYLIFRKK